MLCGEQNSVLQAPFQLVLHSELFEALQKSEFLPMVELRLGVSKT